MDEKQKCEELKEIIYDLSGDLADICLALDLDTGTPQEHMLDVIRELKIKAALADQNQQELNALKTLVGQAVSYVTTSGTDEGKALAWRLALATMGAAGN